MWGWRQGEIETRQRGTGGRRSGREFVGKNRWPHHGEEKNRLQCDQWFHSLLSASGKAFASGNLEVM